MTGDLKIRMSASILMILALSSLVGLAACCGGDCPYAVKSAELTSVDGRGARGHRARQLCDEDMDVVYLLVDRGITVRVDSAGAPVRCSDIRRRSR